MSPLASLAAVAALAAADWRSPSPETLLVVDTTKGRVVVELQPTLAPQAVERIRRLAGRGTYDGLLFHRVIDGFVDQTGNPNNRDGGGTELPDLPPEFDARIPDDTLVTAAAPQGEWYGYLGSLPVAGSARVGPDGRRRVWGVYCADVMGMGRQAGWGTANSELFLMRGAARRLDHDYTAVGRALVGGAVIRNLAVGVPPSRPDRMVKVRFAADLPAAERPRIWVQNEAGAAFGARIRAARARYGADFSPCAVTPIVRIASKKVGLR